MPHWWSQRFFGAGADVVWSVCLMRQQRQNVTN